MKKTFKKLTAFLSAAAICGTALYCPGTVFMASAAVEGIAIDEANFPDEIFRKYVSGSFDTNEDDVLSEEEIAEVTRIEVEKRKIKELTGIEHFKYLLYLKCYGNELTRLDLSKNTLLETVLCQENQLQSLNVSNAAEMTMLCCNNNQLLNLDVSMNTALTYLDCGSNQLTSLDVSKNTKLTELSCSGNQLTTLHLKRNTELQTLECYRNRLTSLDVTNNTALISIYCNWNQLTGLDVRKNTALLYLECAFNQLTTLDLSKNPKIFLLDCSENHITSLDLSKNTDLYNYNTYNNNYEIKLQNGTFDLSTLPVGFDAAKTSDWENAAVDGTILTVTNPDEPVFYTYDCGNESEALFTLIPTAQKTGDTNSDNAVNASDAAQLLIAAAAIGSGYESGLTAAQEQNADVDKNGRFDASDAALILQYAAAVGSGFEGTMEDFLPTLTAPSAWKAAYLELAETFEDDVQFDLVYVDEDDVPELVVSRPSICYLYTFHEDKVSTLMDGWVFGAMGNLGYSYLPRANRVHNHNHDFAGLLRYDTYMKISPEKTLVEDVVVESWMFEDSNGNGYPDTGEYDNPDYVRYVVNDVEITKEEAETYRNGDYTILSGSMTLAELREALA